MAPAETVTLKCPKCGHFLGELGNFLRTKCCGYEIIVSSLRPDGNRKSEQTGATKTVAA